MLHRCRQTYPYAILIIYPFSFLDPCVPLSKWFGPFACKAPFNAAKRIRDYHPDLWQPAWGIRTMMEAKLLTFVNDVNLPMEYTFHSFSQLSQCRFTVEALRSHFPVAGDGAIGTTGLPMFRGIFSAVFLLGTHFRFFLAPGALDWPSDMRKRLAQDIAKHQRLHLKSLDELIQDCRSLWNFVTLPGSSGSWSKKWGHLVDLALRLKIQLMIS